MHDPRGDEGTDSCQVAFHLLPFCVFLSVCVCSQVHIERVGCLSRTKDLLVPVSCYSPFPRQSTLSVDFPNGPLHLSCWAVYLALGNSVLLWPPTVCKTITDYKQLQKPSDERLPLPLTWTFFVFCHYIIHQVIKTGHVNLNQYSSMLGISQYVHRQVREINHQLCECMSKALISGCRPERPIRSLILAEAGPRVTLCGCSEGARPWLTWTTVTIAELPARK